MSANKEIEIPILFTQQGAPARNINVETPGFPVIRIWDSNDKLIVNNAKMSPITDGKVNDGLYKYVFTENDGFDEEETYVTIFDGGSSLPDPERYNYGQIVPSMSSEMKDAVEMTRKFETNKTEIDVNNGELLVYDDDGKTIIWRFKLLNSKGQPSVDEIASRVPVGGLNFKQYVTP